MTTLFRIVELHCGLVWNLICWNISAALLKWHAMFITLRRNADYAWLLISQTCRESFAYLRIVCIPTRMKRLQEPTPANIRTDKEAPHHKTFPTNKLTTQLEIDQRKQSLIKLSIPEQQEANLKKNRLKYKLHVGL